MCTWSMQFRSPVEAVASMQFVAGHWPTYSVTSDTRTGSYAVRKHTVRSTSWEEDELDRPRNIGHQ